MWVCGCVRERESVCAASCEGRDGDIEHLFWMVKSLDTASAAIACPLPQPCPLFFTYVYIIEMSIESHL